jgi:hypothetical protein
MADAGDILGPRRAQMRAATFALSALLICLTLTAILLITWRTHANNPADQGVRTWIEEAPKPKPLPAPVHAPLQRGAVPAAGNQSDIPSSAVLAQMLTCFDADRERHPECGPRWSDPELAPSGPPISTAGPFSPPPVTRVLVTPSRPAWQGIPDDPCAPGGQPQGVTACIAFPDPPPPSKSPEEICEAGLIGPCHPPAFRPEDVVHHQHTD